ncbi:hypothetical protein HDV02_002518 [Globomyces sp. JEL0801]|nr:hypothetical protein HDV02_002518 [Globomyces sp. JEL0801]
MTMPISNIVLATLGCGCFFAGMNLALIQSTLKEYGIHLNLQNDSHRQTVLCLVLLVSTLSAIIVYPVNEEGSQITLINILTLSQLSSVQYGLVIINHNTIFRFGAAYPENKIFKLILKYYGLLYIIPFFTMIPIYLAAYHSIPYNKTLNKHFYNVEVFKPLNIGLVLGTEFLAVITDLRLLVRVGEVTDKTTLRNPILAHDNGLKRKWKKVQKYSKNGLWREYYVIWGLLVLDISIKIAIASGIRLLFDSAVSVTTMIMRGRFNLRYTSLLKFMLENPKYKTTMATQILPNHTLGGGELTVPMTSGFSDAIDSFLGNQTDLFGMKSFNPLDESTLGGPRSGQSDELLASTLGGQISGQTDELLVSTLGGQSDELLASTMGSGQRGVDNRMNY